MPPTHALLPVLLMVLNAALPAVASADEALPLCYGYGCRVDTRFAVSTPQQAEVAQLFAHVATPDDERRAVSQAIGLLERIAGEQTPIRDDKGGNFSDGTSPGRRDCVDHSTTNAEWLLWLRDKGWLRLHTPAGKAWRAPWIVDLHYTAVMTDAGGRQWAVDSWFFDNGHDAAVVPLDVWMKGYSPS